MGSEAYSIDKQSFTASDSFTHSEPTESFVKEIIAMQICEVEEAVSTIKAHIDAFQLTMEKEEEVNCKFPCNLSCAIQ